MAILRGLGLRHSRRRDLIADARPLAAACGEAQAEPLALAPAATDASSEPSNHPFWAMARPAVRVMFGLFGASESGVGPDERARPRLDLGAS